MTTMNPKVDNYLIDGCGRCPLVGTPECKVNSWRAELEQLRAVLLETELTEELKWGVPCYTYDGNNILLLSAFKDYCSLSFFKGVLLKDPDGLLVKQGENVQAGRLLKYTDMNDIIAQETAIKAYVAEAIAIEKSGLTVELKKTEAYDFPDELLAKFEEDPAFEAAFESLTPGRQRGYLLHFSGAKQSKTRTSRIEKAMSDIFEGKGRHDRY